MKFPQPNPPLWPTSVVHFTQDDVGLVEETISSVTGVDTCWDLHDFHGHFSDRRIALLFHPGCYPVNVPTGYYTQILGVGERVSDVRFTGRDTVAGAPKGVFCRAADPKGAGSLDTFWRSAENFTNAQDMRWAVSQAAPLRRVRVEGDLQLFDFGYGVVNNQASGGFCANVEVTGCIAFGSQQQFMSRNCTMSKGTCGVWNFVFVGCRGAPDSKVRTDSMSDFTSISSHDLTPICAEKPFITCSTADEDGYKKQRWALQVPFVRANSAGVDHAAAADGTLLTATTYSFEHVFVARDSDSTSEIQEALDTGLHVLFTPGIYSLSQPLVVATHNQVLLGIGMASLVTASGHATGCIMVKPKTHGVRIAGLMLQANHDNRNLLQWGSDDSPLDGNPFSPGVMSDLFVRVGGPDIDRTVSVDCMVKICSSHVIGDNLWLWRADHALLAPNEVPHTLPWRTEPEKYHLVVHTPAVVEYACATGLEVAGSHVTIYGLAVEHTTKDQTVWSGERGEVYFYQCELPYDVQTSDYEDYVGYRVQPTVCAHRAVGVGVYSYFRDYECRVKTAFAGPRSDMFEEPFTVRLEANNGICSVLNGAGSGPADGDSNGQVYFPPRATT